MKENVLKVLKQYAEPHVKWIIISTEFGFAGTLPDIDDPIDTDPEEDI